jgi:hypothetical protein
MQFPDRDKLQKLLHKEKEINKFEGQEKRVASLIARSRSLLESGKFIESIDEYYNAWNFFESFKAQETKVNAAAITAQLLSTHERMFEEIAKEINLCCAGDKYNKAMYLYETLRLFNDNARKYLDDSTHQDYFKRVQGLYNSMIAIYKLHHPAGSGETQDA